ncbi:MAG TPA: hypothetical protein VMT16_00780 [Thermoanaerobaculia bacterium]|nr:hypothetical protein [Thermoanaerobaculia bacterium]
MFAAPAALLVAGVGATAALLALAAPIAAALAPLAVAFAGLWLALHRARRSVPAVALVLALAAILRLLCLPLPPVLSTDVWRYLWDGRVAAHGENPYLLAPDARQLEPLRDPSWQRLDHRQIPTVYPPLAVGLWSLLARLPAPLVGWKLLVAAADLGACWMLVRLADRAGLSRAGALAYAWNPLPALEGAGMGHLEPLGVAACTAVLLALVSRPPRLLGAAAAAVAGVLVKLAPAAMLPAWSRHSGRPAAFLALTAGLVAAASLPVLVASGGVPPGLVAYAVSWEFGGPLYEPLWRLLALARLDELLAHGLDLTQRSFGLEGALRHLYPWLYPQSLARVGLALAALAVVVRSWRIADPIAATATVFGGLLLCSPTVYPWYLLWALPWAALLGWGAWLWLSAAVLLTYLPQAGVVPLWPWVHLLVWGPFFLLALMGRRWTGG